jgi:RNA polymerase sigma-70 factor (ECF subfamily)
VTFWSIAAWGERDKGRHVITRKEFMADFGYQLESGVAADAHDPMLSDGDAFASGPDLEQLMTRYQQADTTAVTELVERLTPQLYRFFASQTDSRSDAEQMVRAGWLLIHRSRHTYRRGEPVLPWLYAIARCVCLDKHWAWRRTASRETGVSPLRASLLHGDEANNIRRFRELAAGLSAGQREVLTLLKVNGLSIEDVARATSSTAEAVKRKARRGYERLRELLEPAPKAPTSMP